MPVFLVPLAASQPQSLDISLNGIVYGIKVRWCNPAQCWTMDLFDNLGNPLVQGIALITGADLLAQYGYLRFGVSFIVQSSNNPDEVPSFEALGTTGNLYFTVPPS